jgi:hypothetical protein
MQKKDHPGMVFLRNFFERNYSAAGASASVAGASLAFESSASLVPPPQDAKRANDRMLKKVRKFFIASSIRLIRFMIELCVVELINISKI